MNSKQLKFKMKSPHKSGTKAHLVETGLVFGGALNYRKMKRPFRRNKATHLIFRSRLLSGSRSLLKANRRQWVKDLFQEKAKKYHSKIYQFSVNSNHLHLLIAFTDEISQANFLRDVSGTLALKIKKTFRIPAHIKVWDARPFSRIVNAKAFPVISRYIERNTKEASGLWGYKERPLSYLEKVLGKFNVRKSLDKIGRKSSLGKAKLIHPRHLAMG